MKVLFQKGSGRCSGSSKGKACSHALVVVAGQEVGLWPCSQHKSTGIALESWLSHWSL